MINFKNKIAIVTGVGRYTGIGAAICRELAKQGCDVFFTYWSSYDKTIFNSDLIEVSTFEEELNAQNVRAVGYELDLSLPESVQILFEKVIETLGIPNILINNATVSTHQSLNAITSALLDHHYYVNVRATTLTSLEFFVRGYKGHILNLTSGQSLGVMKNELPYTITKASVEMMVLQAANEFFERGIFLNAFDPGPTDTGWMTDEIREMIKNHTSHGKIWAPNEAAQAILTVLHSNASGQIFHGNRD